MPRPRERFGFSSPQPLPGTENPMLSQTVQERFSRAGLEPFLPYLSPYRTIVEAQGIRQFDQALQQQDMEDAFLQTIQQDPKTGLQRFLVDNPQALTSPMVRSYAIAHQKMNQPVEDPFATKAAEGGLSALDAYARGGGGVVGFAAARDEMERRKAESAKKTPEKPWQERMTDSVAKEIRALATATKSAPDDFTIEFEAVKKKNPGITEDEYVRKFKNAPDFATYKRRRTAERAAPVIEQLVVDYGLTQDEAATLLGVPSTKQNVPPSGKSEIVSEQVVAPESAVTKVSPQSSDVPQKNEPVNKSVQAPDDVNAPSQHGFTFKTYSERNPTPLDKLVSEIGGFLDMGKAVASNVAADPAGRLGDVVLGEGDAITSLTEPPITDEENNKRWSEAKAKANEFFGTLGDYDEIKEKLGSLVVEDKVPIDYFMPDAKKTGLSEEDKYLRVPAGVAFLKALAASKMKPGKAFRSKDGNVSWLDVAKAAAQDALEKKGELRVDRPKAQLPTSATPSGNRIVVGVPVKK